MNYYGNHASFLKRLRRVPNEDVSPAGADLAPYYSAWGFTIYRTAYGPSSEEQWKALLDDIRADVVEQITGPDGKCQAEPTAQHIMSLFHLDVRSDPAALGGLNMDDLRKVYKDQVGGRPMNADWKERKFFLLVDQEVVDAHRNRPDDAEYKPWIKCVDVEYVATDYVPRNPRVGPQSYFGWMKLSTRSVPQLWTDFETRWLSELAPRILEGKDVEVWFSYADF